MTLFLNCPVYHGKMCMHYEDRLKEAKNLDERIYLMEQLLYHQQMYVITQN